jgi:membrane protease YdiL (CAAX protease family)
MDALGRRFGLQACCAFYRDRVFCLALLAGGGFWGVLWLTTPMAPLSWQQVVSWWFVSLALWQPCWEELLFRGVLQGSARRYVWGRRSWWGISGANVATALLFALAHWWAHTPLWAAAVLLPALLFGIMRDRYNSVSPAIILHMFYNTGYFWLTGLPV